MSKESANLGPTDCPTSNKPLAAPTKDDVTVSSTDKLFWDFGKCKWFDITKGYGFVTLKNCPNQQGNQQRDVFVYQSVIQMNGFRSLHDSEDVKVQYKKSSLGWEATVVCGPNGEDCIGNVRRPKRRKRPDRCYNCGEAGHHAKECNLPPLPKRCHHCKSIEHLVVDCPNKQESPPDTNETFS